MRKIPLTVWFDQYLRGTSKPPCRKCKAPCCSAYEVWLTPTEDQANYATTRTDDKGMALLQRNEDGMCIYRTQSGCGIYDRRPSACRVYDCRAMAVCGYVPPTPVGAAALAAAKDSLYVARDEDWLLLAGLHLARDSSIQACRESGLELGGCEGVVDGACFLWRAIGTMTQAVLNAQALVGRLRRYGWFRLLDPSHPA